MSPSWDMADEGQRRLMDRTIEAMALALIEVRGGRRERLRAERLLRRGEKLHPKWARVLESSVDALWGAPSTEEDWQRILAGVYDDGIIRRRGPRASGRREARS